MASLGQAATQGSTGPVVRFLEIGDGGLVARDVPATAEVEVAASEPFEGELRAILRSTPDWNETPWVSDQCIVPVSLAKDERRRLQLLFPHSTGLYRSDASQHVDIVWKLLDPRGAPLAAGREKAEQVGAGTSILNLTSEPGSGYRRRPIEAFTQPLRYESYKVVITEARDLHSLNDGQQQALLAAVASGLTVVVSGGFEALGDPWDGILAGGEAIAWTTGASEIREARFLSGRLRRTNISLGAFGALREPEDPRFFPYALATSPDSLIPTGNEFMGFGFEGDYWSDVAKRTGAARLKVIGIVIALLALGLLLVLWRLSRLDRPLGQFNALLVAACVVALAPLSYAILSRFPAGNIEVTSSVRLHDPNRQWDRLDSVQCAGGGGGARVPALTLESTGSSSFSVNQWREPRHRPWMTARQAGSDYELRLEAPVFSGESVLFLRSSAIVRAEPVWEQKLSWEGGRPSGSISFKKALRRAVLISISGRGALRLGRIPANTIVDVGRVPISSLKEFGPRKEPDEDSDSGMIARAADERPFFQFVYFREDSKMILIGEEERPVVALARAKAGIRPQVHVEKVDVLEANADATKIVTLPAYQRGLEIHTAVPDVLPARMYKFRNLEPVRSLPGAGFRELIFAAETKFDFSDRRGSRRADLPPRSFSIPIVIPQEKRQ